MKEGGLLSPKPLKDHGVLVAYAPTWQSHCNDYAYRPPTLRVIPLISVIHPPHQAIEPERKGHVGWIPQNPPLYVHYNKTDS